LQLTTSRLDVLVYMFVVICAFCRQLQDNFIGGSISYWLGELTQLTLLYACLSFD
jgi:hypothetical protein